MVEPTPNTRLAAVIETWQRSPRPGVIFDFNGTLSDDEPLLLQIYQDVFREQLGWTLTPRHYYSRFVGRSDRAILQTVVDERGEDQPCLVDRLLAEHSRRYHELVARCSPIHADTVALVRLLRASDVAIGIATGAQRADVENVLSHAGLSGCFGAVVAAEDVTRGKPDPECFLRCALLLGVDPAQTLAFEDSVAGVRAAKAARMRCVAVAADDADAGDAQLAAGADAVVAALAPRLFSGLTGRQARDEDR